MTIGRTTSPAALLLAWTLVLGGCGGTEAPSGSTPASTSSSDSSTGSEHEHESGHEDESGHEHDSGHEHESGHQHDSGHESANTVPVRVRGATIEPTAMEQTIAVGETVVLEIDSDRAGELHVHSTPEQEVAFDAGTSRVRITLDQPGSVDVEEHESGALLLRILVR